MSHQNDHHRGSPKPPPASQLGMALHPSGYSPTTAELKKGTMKLTDPMENRAITPMTAARGAEEIQNHIASTPTISPRSNQNVVGPLMTHRPSLSTRGGSETELRKGPIGAMPDGSGRSARHSPIKSAFSATREKAFSRGSPRDAHGVRRAFLRQHIPQRKLYHNMRLHGFCRCVGDHESARNDQFRATCAAQNELRSGRRVLMRGLEWMRAALASRRSPTIRAGRSTSSLWKS